MTKKKRELIEILLDNVKPEDWPENFPFAAQDKCDAAVYVYNGMPDSSTVYNGSWVCGPLHCKYITMLDVLCKYWNKTSKVGAINDLRIAVITDANWCNNK